MTGARVFILGALILAACGETTQQQIDREKREAWDGPCQDESVLLATTAGSPNAFTCPNRLHRMRVQVATAPSNEEAAAVVFCECTDKHQAAAPAAHEVQP